MRAVCLSTPATRDEKKRRGKSGKEERGTNRKKGHARIDCHWSPAAAIGQRPMRGDGSASGGRRAGWKVLLTGHQPVRPVPSSSRWSLEASCQSLRALQNALRNALATASSAPITPPRITVSAGRSFFVVCVCVFTQLLDPLDSVCVCECVCYGGPATADGYGDRWRLLVTC